MSTHTIQVLKVGLVIINWSLLETLKKLEGPCLGI